MLAAGGLFASLSFDIRQRRFELSVRQALGAPPRAIAIGLLATGLAPVVLGLVLGVPATWMARRLFESHLFGVSPFSPVPYLVAGVALLTASALACLGPASEAARSSPLEILRDD